MSKCDEKLIADHKDVLIGDFQNLLDFDKDEGLLPYEPPHWMSSHNALFVIP